jgi:uncharacterized protein YeaO (DUF488 family)
MPIRIVRLGSQRLPGEGLRLGTVRRPPRGVRKEDFARLDYFDVWLPELAPPAHVVTWALSEPWTAKRWETYAKKYRSQLRQPMLQRLLSLLVALSTRTNLSVGCYCEDENRCHRSLLRDILMKQGAVIHD